MTNPAAHTVFIIDTVCSGENDEIVALFAEFESAIARHIEKYPPTRVKITAAAVISEPEEF